MSSDDPYLEEKLDDYILSGRRLPDEFPYLEQMMEDKEAYEAQLEKMSLDYIPDPDPPF